jgi:hypothetical protein
MSAKWGEGRKEKPLDFSGDIGLWQRKITEGPEGTARRMAVFEALAKLKAHLRAAGARTYEALWRAVGIICEPKECWNFFRHAGYVAT